MAISLADITDEHLDRVQRVALKTQGEANRRGWHEAQEDMDVLLALVAAFRTIDRKEFGAAEPTTSWARGWAKASEQLAAQRQVAQELKDNLATLTRNLRQSLDKMGDTHASAQDLLGSLEEAAGLVNPETGERWDERVSRIHAQIVESSKVDLG